MWETPRVLTPKGEILRLLLIKERSTSELSNTGKLAKPTIYRGLKDLIIAGWVKCFGDKCKTTKEGVKAFWSALFDDELTDRLIGASENVGVSTYELVVTGVRLILDVIEYGVLHSEVWKLIEQYDPVLAERLKGLVVKEVVG